LQRHQEHFSLPEPHNFSGNGFSRPDREDAAKFADGGGRTISLYNKSYYFSYFTMNPNWVHLIEPVVVFGKINHASTSSILQKPRYFDAVIAIFIS
jgi:hypothetical protein